MSALQAIQRRTGGSQSRNPYARALGAAAAIVSLAGLGIGLYVYSRWTPDSQPGQGGDEWAAGGGSRHGTQSGPPGADATGKGPSGGAAGAATKPQARRGPRPTLSLSLPPPFDRTSPTALQLLHDLVAVLAEHFLIHLILPDSPSSSAPASAGTAETGASGSGTGALAAVFADVLDFDARRLLLYSTSAGRQALSVALACDAHVEVSFFADGTGADSEAGGLAAEAAEDDGAAIKSVEHLQRTAGVVVLLVLPSPDVDSAAPPSAFSRSSFEATLEYFKKASFSRSIRIIDTRVSSAAGAAPDVAEQWQEGADRIVELRAKMKR
ncbi:hypothetical protein OC834_006682 [Tilletia horrida]|uniref:Uncharacterized protein n=1 Tax=Tilletia horrida TaxID=155126 RepID=A0AAN6G5G8_9BASI|nr:hypothetical protein OC834_006682 [Tilletia horrida]KAK0521603.1 hypothetical protein OC842_006726 [Tilletia horrida]KAK0523532.1 hypothetical protein OC835_006229 [Tilletia horrida]KAK0550791.1 hypothetical protein OC844_006673 [Tilletia horrida]